MTSSRDLGADAQIADAQINVTPAAREAIARLIETNGEIVFHISGGCCDARTPVCLPAGELQIGPRDRLMGRADGIPVYEMGENDGSRATYALDVTRGAPTGFSLSPGDGKCFALRQTR